MSMQEATVRITQALERFNESLWSLADATWWFQLGWSNCDPDVLLAIRIGREVDRWFALTKRGEW